MQKGISNIDMKFCMILLHSYPEGSMCQIFYLGPSLCFMGLEKNVLKIYKKLPNFSCKIKIKITNLRHASLEGNVKNIC